MCAADLAPTVALRRGPAAVQSFGTLVVCGGGCYGSYYVRQLMRAEAAGAVRWERLLVVDQDASCRVAGEGVATVDESGGDDAALVATTAAVGGVPPRLDHAPALDAGRYHSPAPRLVVSPWTDFFDAYLGDAVARPGRSAHDAIVPSPLMPHLMFEWLLRRARSRWPTRTVAAESLGANPGMPWHRHAEAATYVSYAEWMCPINCIEPARCPETRGPRHWSVAPALHAWVDDARAAGSLAAAAVLQCTHRAYGVGMFDTAAVLEADRVVAESAAGGEARILVGTVSHCHGAIGVVHVGP